MEETHMHDDTTTRPQSGVTGSGELATDEAFITCPKCGKGCWERSIKAGKCLGCQRQASIDRATARAHEEARAGHVPALLASDVTPDGTRQVWAVISRTRAGRVYLVDLIADHNGVETLCQCEAAGANRVCFHRAAARLALFRDIPHHDARGYQGDPEELAELMAWWSAEPDPADPADWTMAAD
jgi:hypothetical protein